MKIYQGIKSVQPVFNNSVVAIGVFDGVHLGHQQLIRYMVKRARQIKGTAVVFTFSPHPVHVLNPEIYLPLIVSLPYRLKLIEQLGVDVCVVAKFYKYFSKFSPEDFVCKYLLKRLAPKEIVIGNDFKFGQGRSGDIQKLRRMGGDYGFGVHVVSIQKTKGQKVGSSSVRKCIMMGNLIEAERLLWRPVSILGVVTRGDGRGRSLGYPTANIVPSDEMLPPMGVYAVRIQYAGSVYPGMASVGVRPTFKNTKKVNLEVYIFNFHKNIYGKEIIVEFLKKFRDEIKFQSQEELIRFIQDDERKIKQWFFSLEK